MSDPVHPPASEQWRSLLSGESTARLVRGRELYKHLPSPPRCKLCLAPFAGPGGAVMRHLGYARWPKSPRFCQQCHKTLAKAAVGGAEVEISVLFADLRGSTSLAETMSPTAFGNLINRFYAAADAAITGADGVVDNHIGDGVLGLFIPVWAGHDHPATAIRAARELMVATGNDGAAPWAPVGIGINTGVAFVGIVSGSEEPDDFTALGDVVNTASRLSSTAQAGEILISMATATEAGVAFTAAQRRSLQLKGKQELFEAVAIAAR